MPSFGRRALLLGGLASAGLLGAGAYAWTASRTRSVRPLVQRVAAVPHVDGAGVKLEKLLGMRALPLLDPFLMLDRFRSNNPDDYIRGFPNHPHRGFETVTLMLEGHVAHRDSLHNAGDITAGGVQWMTAGRGIIHAEMPRASETTGALWGYQLWVNLPARHKMTAPRYQDLSASSFVSTAVDDANVRVLAGAVGATRGAVDGVVTRPTLLDVQLPAGGVFRHALPSAHTAFCVVAAGTVEVAANTAALSAGELGVLGAGDTVHLRARTDARVLLFAGAPIGEPVARRGPFVMNTEAELDQAVSDYRAGRLVQG